MLDLSFSYADLEYFLLIFVRVAAFIFIIPFFSMNSVPRRFRAGLAVVISVLLFGVLNPRPVIEYHTVLGYAIIVTKEFVTGLLLGMGVYLCTTIISVAGTVADMEIGFSMVSLLDPATKDSTTITSTMYQYMIMLILIVSGMYRYILGALSESYQLIPVNGAHMDAEKILAAMTRFMSEYLSIGFQICLPIFAAILMLNVVLGIMAKVAPQMNMFSVGLQLKVFVGLMIVFVIMPLLPLASDLIFTEAKKMTVLFVEALM